MEWEKYWRRTVIKYLGKRKDSIAYWIARCDCGKEREVRLTNLKIWKSKSCWCIQRETASRTSKTHWLSNTRFARVYKWIKGRCSNKKNPAYKNYGGRGIKCERWTFKEFIEDMRPSYSHWLTIERIDNNWNYSKENCRRATRQEQARNRRTSLVIEYRWETKILKDWCTELWLNYERTRQRIKRYNYTIENAFNKPKQYEE